MTTLSKDYLRAIVDGSADAIITINVHSLVLSFKKTAEILFGYRAEDIIGKNINLLMPEGLHSIHDGYVKDSTLYARRIFNTPRDLIALKKDGTLFPVELNISPMNIKGEKIFIGILRDISKCKEQERLLAESQAGVPSSLHIIFGHPCPKIICSEGDLMAVSNTLEAYSGL